MSGNLCGYVVRGRQPVVDAAITIVEGPGQHIDVAPLTDSDGWFALDDLSAGNWRLRAHHPDGTGETDVHIWDDSLSEVTIVLGEVGESRPAPQIEATGIDPDAQVAVGSLEPPVDDAISGHDSLASARRTSRPLGRERRTQGLTPGSVVGWVTDAATGCPVAGAFVVVSDGPGPLPDTAVRTDVDGSFVIAAMEPGDWALSVHADDNAQGELTVAVLSGRRADVRIALVRSPS